jgi:hypothetical protein
MSRCSSAIHSPRPQARRRGEQHERSEARAEFCRERVQLVPGLERPLLCSAALRVIDSLLRGVHVDHPPAHRAREYLPERLCCLEAMSRRDGHPPRRDLGRSQLADPAVAEYTHRLRKQPAQLLDRLRLATVLGQVHLDQLTQPRRLDQASLAPKPHERPLESLGRSPLRFEPAALDPARTATAEAMPIRPAHRIAVLRLLWEHLSLLRHRHHLRPLVRGDGLRSPGGAALHTTCAHLLDGHRSRLRSCRPATTTGA